MNSESRVRNFDAGQAAYRRQDIPNSDRKSALGAFRAAFVASCDALKVKRGRLEADIQKVKETYSNAVASSKISDLRQEFNRDVSRHQNELTRRLNNAMQGKAEALKKYVTTPPTAEQFGLLQALQMRDAKGITDDEFSMLIAQLVPNYQAAVILKDIATRAGKDIKLPFAPDEASEELQRFQTMAEGAINNILDFENNYYASELYRADVTNSHTSEVIRSLDAQIATTVPDEDFSVVNRLKKARQNALHVGDYDLFNQISDFISAHRDTFESPEKREADILESAEELISAGMNTKGKR